jgi:hypothetical protein
VLCAILPLEIVKYWLPQLEGYFRGFALPAINTLIAFTILMVYH